MKVIIAAGGTGGHIFPGVAIAQELINKTPSTEILFVGTKHGLESQIIPNHGFPLALISAQPLKNISLIKKIKSLATIPYGMVAVIKLLEDFGPDIVIGVGGYSAGTVLLVAALKGIPTIILEPNALPGFTNRVLGRFVDLAAVTFKESINFFPNKAVITGTPVRSEFELLPQKIRTKGFHLLVFGGSQGAHAINQAMIEGAPILSNNRSNLLITHQTGKSDLEAVKQTYENLRIEADVRPFIDDMARNFETADLLVCRAGAITTAEVAAAGKAAIFIPFPQAADNHQLKNAEAFVRVNAAKLIEQSELTGERLAREILFLISTPEKITVMEQASRQLSTPNASKNVAELIMRLVDRSSTSHLLAS